MNIEVSTESKPRAGESGFTLIEALIAMIILTVGLIAIANLFVVASSSNQIGNYTTVSAANASDIMEKLKAVPFMSLALYSKCLTPCGAAPPYVATDPWRFTDWEESTTNWGTVPAALAPCDSAIGNKDGCTTSIPGIGTVLTRWKVIDPGGGGTLARFILVQSEVLALLGRGTRSQFSTFRVCISTGCP